MGILKRLLDCGETCLNDEITELKRKREEMINNENVDGLGGLNTQIAELQKKRTELINLQKFENEEEIKSLYWLKDCHGTLTIGFGVYGLPNYQIKLYGPKIPSVYEAWTAFGNDMHYFNNINITSGWFGEIKEGVIETSNAKLLIEFLQKYPLKSFNYAKNDYEVLDFIHKTYGA